MLVTSQSDNLSNLYVDYKDSRIAKLPKVILLKIFSILSGMDLTSCMRVCTEWNNLTSREEFWRARLLNSHRYDVIDDFSPLVAKGVLTWKEVVHFSPLTDLFADNFFQKVEAGEKADILIVSRNKELENIQFSSLYMPRHFIRHGNLTFTIVDSSNVEIKRKGKYGVEILKGEKGIMLTHLVIEGKSLFTLRSDGIIVRWDYENKEIVQEIETAYSKKDPRFNSLRESMTSPLESRKFHGETLCRHKGFVIKDNFIFLRYNILTMDEIIEIINYANPNESPLTITLKERKIHQHDLYIKKNKLLVISLDELIVWDLITKTQQLTLETDPWKNGGCCDIDVEKNVICACRCDGTISLIDAITGNELKSCKFPNGWWNPMTRIGNLFIGCTLEDNVAIIDLNTWELICEIENIFDFKNNSINTKAFTKLINICKNPFSKKLLKPKNCNIA